MEIKTLLKPHPIIPVLVIRNAQDAVPIAKALDKGGIHIIEITLRTPEAITAIKNIKAALPHMIIGAGTVLNEKQMIEVNDIPVDFAVSPASSTMLIKKAQSLKLPFLAGAITPTEVLHAKELGMTMLKFFPAHLSGGTKMLKTFEGVFPDITFCPTGGITQEIANDYLSLSNVDNIGGSWLVTQTDVENKDWNAITQRANKALGAI